MAMARHHPPESRYAADDCEATWIDQKRRDILDACCWRDLSSLRSLAESRGGFLDDHLRRAAWPILLGVPSSEAVPDGQARPRQTDSILGVNWEQLPRHREEDQVQLDVNRSFIYYPNDQSDAELEQRKTELSSLIVEVLRRNPYLCYFQGFHDICQVFMLVLDPAWRARAVARLSVLRIRDFMLPSLGPTTAQLRLLPDILAKADTQLRRHIASIEPFYALAGTLTMYAHNIENYRDIARLFDVFLAREPVFSIYVFAQIVVDRRDEILEIDESDMLQVILAKVPSGMDIDALIAKSVRLFDRHPPDSLRSWRRVSDASVLKTARDISVCASQTLDQGHAYFQQQIKEIRWLDTQDRVKMLLWRHRRPIRLVGMAFAVAALGFYLRRNPSVVQYVLSLLQGQQ
ncbi:rab-GTPase-TBC domain-containing protein [Hirsutella rhossiliensis]|uniref:Rab-GTPase-TBC domain-containing protein n=1 Tax=Hirsutella rhossiliensis TaxID=111463 RepID=A0A9P8N4F7_9HYPO|nr:rab-GTPase-TBC domain-containing protein [Hirsutella rhossiliensis]KAH0964482.1 rab-GTPase-TBC domain-containing protein [Hirsutella rhossiliensis]